jgi:hypothetical protein
MDKVQKFNNCINMPSSHIFRSYFQIAEITRNDTSSEISYTGTKLSNTDIL